MSPTASASEASRSTAATDAMSLMQIQLPFDATRLPAIPAPPALPTPMIFVRHPRARRYIIRVTDGGVVRVTIPRWGSKKGARAFAEQEQSWVDKQRERIGSSLARADGADNLMALRERAK